MNKEIRIGVLGNKRSKLYKLLSYMYLEKNIIALSSLKDLYKMDITETPDVIFLRENDFNFNSLNTISQSDQGFGTAVFCVNVQNGVINAYFNSNILYTSKVKDNNFSVLSAVDTMGKMIRQNKNQLLANENFSSLNDLEIYLDMINLWDSYTKGHCVRTQKYANYFANSIGLDKEDKENISSAALLHDIGKISIPKDILLKNGKLTSKEFSIIKNHALAAIKYLPTTKFSQMKSIIVAHHENYNGSGYPYGLSKNQIPMGASVISLADSLDAMTTSRGYNKVKTLYEARAEILKFAGKQFEPNFAKQFVEMIATKDFEDYKNYALEESKKQKVLTYK